MLIQQRLEEWENEKKDYLIKQEILSEVHEETRKENYFKGVPNAIHHYSNVILSNSTVS